MEKLYSIPKATPIATIANPTASGMCAFATSLFRLFDNAQIATSKRPVERT